MQDKIRRYIRIRYRAFKAYPLLFICHGLRMVFFRLIGLFICIILTVIPLPLSNLAQHFMNLNISLNSFKDFLTSLERVVSYFKNILPSFNDIFNLLRAYIANFNVNAFLSITRSLPGDFRRFVVQFFATLGARFHDLKLFIYSLRPISQIPKRLRRFFQKHILLIRRIIRDGTMGFFGLLFVKLFFLFIVPILSIGVIRFVGVDISFVIIAVLSLISSQLGSLCGRLINNLVFAYYKKYVKQRPLIAQIRFHNLITRLAKIVIVPRAYVLKFVNYRINYYKQQLSEIRSLIQDFTHKSSKTDL